MEKTPEELRQRAADIRLSANHAERSRDARKELQQADQLEAEADRLEGKVLPEPPKPPTAAQTKAAKSRHNEMIDRVRDEMVKRFGRP